MKNDTLVFNRVLVTGGSGFIGRHLLRRLITSNWKVLAPARTHFLSDLISLSTPLVNSLQDIASDPNLFKDCDAVVHLAALAHQHGVEEHIYKEVNVDATVSIARTAAASGVKRFIFLSSIGVNGVSSLKPFTPFDVPSPSEIYAFSKHRAEEALRAVSEQTGMELVIIRPPLVYGANAPGNFGKLAKLVHSNFPLPFGAIHNKRSFVSVENLVDLIFTCLTHKGAAGETFLVSDNEDISTTGLLQIMIAVSGSRSKLLPVPMAFLMLVSRALGRGYQVERLCSDLEVDISHTLETLAWSPKLTLMEGMQHCFDSIHL